MANVIKKTTNKFSRGLVLDFSPENTKNEVLTHALNATLLTFNGNELSLLNDMGNARVETAYLPEGYMPVGTCEYGGIIYIVSYNPLENKSLIGCFPSPERNVSQEELGIQIAQDLTITNGTFLGENGDLTLVSHKVLLRSSNLNPGDKFIVYANDAILNQNILDLYKNDNLVEHPVVSFSVVSIEDSGKIVYLNSDVRTYDVFKEPSEKYTYHILGQSVNSNSENGKIDIDSYRNVLSSGYSVFKEKTSGKLAILAELIMIDSYSVTHKIEPIKDSQNNDVEGSFLIVVSTDVSPQLSLTNYTQVPKLRYYYLSNSLGKLQSSEGDVNLFTKSGSSYVINPNFLNLNLNKIIDSDSYTGDLDLNEIIATTSKFNFPKPNTYHGRLVDFDKTTMSLDEAYAVFEPGKFYRIDKDLVYNDSSGTYAFDELYFINELGVRFYKYMPSSTEHPFTSIDLYSNEFIYYIKHIEEEYVDCEKNIEYKESDLYKRLLVLKVASKEIILDTSIEKFEQTLSYIFKLIEDNTNRPDGTVYIKTESGYTSYSLALDPNGEYYTMEVVYEPKSVGYEIDYDEITDNLYFYEESNLYEKASEEELSEYWSDTESDLILYRIETTERIEETIKKEVVEEYLTQNKEIYYKTDYELVSIVVNHPTYEECTNKLDFHQLFLTVSDKVIAIPTKFLPNETKNCLYGYDRPTSKDVNAPATGFPKDDFITLKAFAQFIPLDEQTAVLTQDAYKYNDVKLAEITLPQAITKTNMDLPFVYDYTLIPCMGYGKLEHLAVSNTIDFNNIRNFSKSAFTTWKYRIDGNQLMLTFGADVYDTFEPYKVSSLFLEFYDWRGFVGSLEIIGKKSYSGKFTKIITLDSLNALANKKIKFIDDIRGEYIENYNHNVNILQYTDDEASIKFKLNGKEVSYNPNTGWKYVNETNTELGEANDCGVVYSNMIYGVKPYLVILEENATRFIKKPNLFLYTIPVYNDYYYSTNNFNTFKPSVNLILTYKLEDNSTIEPYENDTLIENGYCNEYSESLQTYLSGSWDTNTSTEFNLTRYFKYKGNTKLNLEIGLHLDYEQYHLSCDPEINNYFSCKLLLMSDDGSEICPKSTETVDLDILKHKKHTKESIKYVNSSDHYFGFINTGNTSNSIEIPLLDFINYNFITKNSSKSIILDYNFIVGYDIKVHNITDNTTPATTVCALYHKLSNGEYNNSDFGVYQIEHEEKQIYVPSVMYYNSGSESELLFGLCKMVNITGNTMIDQCLDFHQYSRKVLPMTTPGKLNAGSPLKDVVDQIGKLSFCQPHAHGLYASHATNITKTSDSASYVGDSLNNEYCTKKPIYNMCANTPNCINNTSEFISATINGKSENRTRFAGLYAEEIAKFTRCMLETMKGVYAYNPDYDYVPVKSGEIVTEDHQLQMTSNIISIDSELNCDFNSLLKLGAVKVSDYLSDLNNFSNIDVKQNGKWIPQVDFKPDLLYCGSEENPYLVSSLTYNLPIPQKLYDDLLLNFSNSVVVKHANGEHTFIEGSVNNRSLYGWFGLKNKLVELDITNYNIDLSNGLLSVLEVGEPIGLIEIVTINEFTEEEYKKFYDDGYIMKSVRLENGETIDLKIVMNNYEYKQSYMGIETSKHSGDGKSMTWMYYCVEHDYSESNTYPMLITAKAYLLASSNTKGKSALINDVLIDIEVDVIDGDSSDPFKLSDYGLYDLTLLETDDIKNIKNEKGVKVYTLHLTGIDYAVSEDTYYYFYGDLFKDYNEWSSQVMERVKIRAHSKGNGLQIEHYPSVNSYVDYTYPLGKCVATNTVEINGLGITVRRYRFSNIKVAVSRYNSSFDSDSGVIPLKFKTKQGSFNYDGTYNVTYVSGAATTLLGSTITINDLVYYPEITGHRLFLRNGLHRSSNTRNSIIYRINKSTNLDESLNGLKTYTGPCYVADINIDKSDPEYIKTS